MTVDPIRGMRARSASDHRAIGPTPASLLIWEREATRTARPRQRECSARGSDDELGIVPAHEAPVGVDDYPHRGQVVQGASRLALHPHTVPDHGDREALPPLQI